MFCFNFIPGLPPLSPGAKDQQFVAIGCNVTRAHVEITCFTSQGAGSKHQWKVHVAGMSSVLAETSFGKPTITSITALNKLGVSIPFSSLTSRGGDVLTIIGTNFGPPSKSTEYLNFVKYGKTGVEYLCSNARVITHTRMTCTTTAGTGDGLVLTVSVLGQEGTSAAATISYAQPTITSVSTTRNSNPGASADTIETSPNFRLLLNATNAGVGLRNGNILSVLWDDKEMSLLPDDARTRRDGTVDVIAVRLPTLVGSDGVRSHNVPIRLRVTDLDGSTQISPPFTWSYTAPHIDQIHVTTGPSSSQRRLTLVGSNFGEPDPVTGFPVGSVLLTNGDGGQQCSQFPCEVPLFTASSDMYIESWTHRAITLVYKGTHGTMVVRTSRVTGGSITSNAQDFSNTSPTIITGGLSSDQPGDAVRYETVGFIQGVGGILKIVCQYCDASFLSVLVGETRAGQRAGRAPQKEIRCPLIGTPEYPVTLTIDGTTQNQLTRLECEVPPGMGANVSVVVVRAGSRSLSVNTLQYLLPSIDTVSSSTSPTKGSTVTIDGQNFGDPNAARCYLGETPLLTRSESSGRNRLECTIPPGVGSKSRDVWIRVAGQDTCRKSKPSSTCIGESPTLHYLAPSVTDVVMPAPEDRSTEGGFEITLIGENFATTGVGSNVTIAGTKCIVVSTSFGEIKCMVQEAVGEGLGIEVQVADQISGRPGAGSSSIAGGGGGADGVSLPVISYTRPEIFSVSPSVIPTNAMKSDGTRYKIELVGKNFGTELLTPFFKIYCGEMNSNNVAVITHGPDVLIHDHRRIVFFAPPGQGKQLKIVVEVGPTLRQAQNSTDPQYLSYTPPSVTKTFPTRGPTDGCSDRAGWEPLVVWAERVDGVDAEELATNPKVYRRTCDDPFMMEIHGTNFGTDVSKMTARVVSQDGKIIFPIYPPDPKASHDCPKLVYDHQRMSLCSPIGHGVGLSLIIEVGGQRITNTMNFDFEPPRVTSVDPKPFDGSKSSELAIRGVNFGGINIGDVDIIIGNFRCENPQWMPSHPSDGFPYVQCDSQIDVVGARNISLFVAGQYAVPTPILQSDFTTIVRSECLPGTINSNGETNNTW